MQEVVLGPNDLVLEEKVSVTKHAEGRWGERISPQDNAKESILKFASEGIKQEIEGTNSYKIVDKNIHMVAKQLSPLHKLIITVYKEDRSPYRMENPQEISISQD